MQKVVAGQQLIDLIKLVYQANQPLLLYGKHGVGKSELLGNAAKNLGLQLIVRDLSLMEPPDLIGIPQIREGKTFYAAPSFLPTNNKGLLVFEELNRCPRYMQTPCLQLLTSRTLNDYTLPEGWLPCAAINDTVEGYFTDELDAALLSRFLRVKVVADVEEWLKWAQNNTIHPKIVAFVESSPQVFDDPMSNPRAWAYASKLLIEWEKGKYHQDMLVIALAGILNEKWALAFISSYLDSYHPLEPKEIIEDYPAHQATMCCWVTQGKLDLVQASLKKLQRYLQPHRTYSKVVNDASYKSHVEAFLADLPADLLLQVREWLEERGFVDLIVGR